MSAAVASAASIAAAARALEAGALVAFPTETVYGLGADAENPPAVARIYAAKGRPSDHPVIVHIASAAALTHWAQNIPDLAWQLAQAFWPGPLTMILARAAHIPAAVSGGQDTLGVRCPAHPVALALLAQFKGGLGGIAAPSANKFGHVSPTTAAHVREEFAEELLPGGLIACVLDGGQSEVGIESTILDLSRLASHGPVLLRPGQISAAQLATVIGSLPASPDATAPRASGTLEAHYAPRSAVAQVAAADLAALIVALQARGKQVAVLSHHVPAALAPSAWRCLPTDARACAHDLYAALRELDHLQADVILLETLPQEAEWQGVNDRLRRAAFDTRGVLQQLLV